VARLDLNIHPATW